MKKTAVIDLGTNTFHLLIVELQTDQNPIFREVFRERRYVKLGANGLDTIEAAAFDRGLAAMRHFSQVLEKEGITKAKVQAIATEGLRRASNGGLFIKQVLEQTGIEIRCISGEQEAEYIYHGIRQAVALQETPSLIMDIGGGSVELIIADKNGIHWKNSFPIGAAVLKKAFHQQDPIPSTSIDLLHKHIKQTLTPFLEVASGYNLKQLIGSSGAFDAIASVCYSNTSLSNQPFHDIPIAQFKAMARLLIEQDLATRIQLPGLEPKRADLIVVSYLLIEWLLVQLPIDEIIQTDYAIKEGVLIGLKAGEV